MADLLTRGIPGLYDCAIDGKGYLLADELQKSWAPLRTAEGYHKVGKDLHVERQDMSHELSDNKLDGLFRSSQRSYYSGAGQKRIDNPQSSDPEMFLRGKNIDPFSERGALTLSRRIMPYSSGTAGTQAESHITASDAFLYWAGNDGTTFAKLRSIGQWGDTATVRGFDANWNTANQIQGLTNDGANVYVSTEGTSPGVWRGALSAQSTAMTRINIQPMRDIRFVKQRIMGWATNGGTNQVWSLDPIAATVQQVGTNYPPGTSFGLNYTQGTAERLVFASVKGYIAWIVNTGKDGLLFLWDGVNAPFQAARFPGWRCVGITDYAEQNLYIVAQGPSNPLTVAKWACINVDVSASGDASWEVLHTVDNFARGSLAIRGTEMFFCPQLLSEDTTGLTVEAGVLTSSNTVNTVASLNVVNGALLPARYWGLTVGTAISATLWGDTGYTVPALAVFRDAVAIAGETGGLRAETADYAPTGQLLSSAIDYNVSVDKTFQLAELGSDPLPSSCRVVFEYTTQDPAIEPPIFQQVVVLQQFDRFNRGRLLDNGVKAQFMYYRLTMSSSIAGNAVYSSTTYNSPSITYSSVSTQYGGTGGSFVQNATPVVRKASLAATYGLKPVYEHHVVIRAHGRMTLRDGSSPWPPDRSIQDIPSELEALRDSQEIVNFQAPSIGMDPEGPVQVQVRQVERIRYMFTREGWGQIVDATLVEVPT